MTEVLNLRESTEPSWNWNELIKSFAEEPFNFQHRRTVSQGTEARILLFHCRAPVSLITVEELSLQITWSKVRERHYVETLRVSSLEISIQGFSLLPESADGKQGPIQQANKSSFTSKGAYLCIRPAMVLETTGSSTTCAWHNFVWPRE